MFRAVLDHHRQFLKFCSLSLSTQQSGQFRGTTKLSKCSNAKLLCALWMAATESSVIVN